MKVTKQENVEKNVVKLTIEIDKETFAEGMNRAYKKNVKHFNIPGFRKGHAPRKIIEQYYGEAIFYEDAVNFVCPDAYEAAVKEAGIDPVDRPEIDVETIGAGENLVITATVTVKPEVKLGEYKGVEVEKTEYKTAKADVDKEIEAARDKNSRMVTVEDRAVKQGDFTVIDFEGFVDGVAFEGGKGTDHTLEIGSGQFIPGFEEQLIGAEIGKEVDVNVTFPEEYHAEELKGKPAVFKVTVKEIKEKELPELDDDFAKDISEFDTFDEYKKSVKAKLDEANADKTKAEFENAVIEAVADKCEVDIPQCMIDNHIDNLVRDFDYRLASQGLNMERYLQLTGMTLDAFKAQFADQAQTQVKCNLVLEAIADAEKVEATDADVEKEMEKMAQMYNMELDKVKSFMREEEIENLKRDIRVRKAVDFLADSAVAKKKEKAAAKKAAPKAKKEAADSAEKPAVKKTAAKAKTTTAKKTTTTKKTTTKKKADAEDK